MIDESPARQKRSAQIVDQIARFFPIAGNSKITMNRPKSQLNSVSGPFSRDALRSASRQIIPTKYLTESEL
jgi:hypothetical protein